MLKRVSLGLLALITVAFAGPLSAAPPANISMTVGVCDPSYPSTRCMKPNADGSININGAIAVNSAAVATASPPTYSEGATAPLSQDLSGHLRTTGGGGGGGGATVTATAAAPTYVEGSTDNPISSNLTGDQRVIAKQSGAWTITDVTTVGTISAPVGVKGADGGTILSASNPIPVNDAGGSITVDGTVNAVQSGTWNVNNLSGTVSLPTGASTAALQTTGNGFLSTIATNTGAATPAGTAIIGKVGIDQTTPGTTNLVAAGQNGTWNITNVSGTVSLPTGAATATLQGTGNTSLGTIVTNTTGLATATAQTTGNGYLSTIAAAAADTTPATVNITQVAGSSVATGSGTATGAQRVEIANNGTGTVGLNAGSNIIGAVTQSGSWTVTTGGLAQGSTTSGQTGGLTMGAVTTAAPTYTTAQTSPLNLTTGGALRTDETTIAGTAVATSNGGVSAGVQRVAIANDSTGQTRLTDGTNVATVKAASTQAATTDTSLVVAQSPNPNTLCDQSVAISQTASTDVLTSTAKIHICSIILVSDTAQFINVIEGTGTVCATSGAALIGSTTAGSGLSVAANGGFSAVAERAWLKTKVTADHLCVTQSGSGRLSGVITYRDAS